MGFPLGLLSSPLNLISMRRLITLISGILLGFAAAGAQEIEIPEHLYIIGYLDIAGLTSQDYTLTGIEMMREGNRLTASNVGLHGCRGDYSAVYLVTKNGSDYVNSPYYSTENLYDTSRTLAFTEEVDCLTRSIVKYQPKPNEFLISAGTYDFSIEFSESGILLTVSKSIVRPEHLYIVGHVGTPSEEAPFNSTGVELAKNADSYSASNVSLQSRAAGVNPSFYIVSANGADWQSATSYAAEQPHWDFTDTSVHNRALSATAAAPQEMTISPGTYRFDVRFEGKTPVMTVTTDGLPTDAVFLEAVDNHPVEYFNLQGMRVGTTKPGLYIRRQGSALSKVYIR